MWGIYFEQSRIADKAKLYKRCSYVCKENFYVHTCLEIDSCRDSYIHVTQKMRIERKLGNIDMQRSSVIINTYITFYAEIATDVYYENAIKYLYKFAGIFI